MRCMHAQSPQSVLRNSCSSGGKRQYSSQLHGIFFSIFQLIECGVVVFWNNGDQLYVMCILPTEQVEIKINSNRLSMHTHIHISTPNTILTHTVCSVLIALFQQCLRFSCIFSCSGILLCLSTAYPKPHVIESQQYHTFLLRSHQLLLYLFKQNEQRSTYRFYK